MPDLDIRETARVKAKAIRFRLKGHDYPANRHYKLGFEDGAQWAVDQLPDKAELTAAMHQADCGCKDGHDEPYTHQADAVLALIVEKLTAT